MLYNKLCLDIGCNDGKLTAEIAKVCKPRLIIGIDVDNHLIECAEKLNKRIIFEHEIGQLAKLKENQLINDRKAEHRSFPSKSLSFIPRTVKIRSFQVREIVTDSTGIRKDDQTYPYNMKYLCKTVFQLSSTSIYDVVLCLSVVKWVHLNEGDEGLLTFFKRIHELLKVDGLLFLEFQPWKSYVNNRATSERTKRVFPTLQIRPEDFKTVLEEEIGFHFERNLGCELKEACGFNRPIYLLRKRLITDHTKSLADIVKKFADIRQAERKGLELKRALDDIASSSSTSEIGIDNISAAFQVKRKKL